MFPSMNEEPDIAVTRDNTTTFIDDGISSVESKVSKVEKGDFIVRDQSIVDFLAKPALVSSFTWTTAKTLNENLFGGPAVTDGSVYTILAANTRWMNKIQGYNLIRGTAVFTIKHNGNPFQAGKLLLRYIPNYIERATLDASFDDCYNSYLASKVQHPHCYLDVRESSCVFKIPYIAPTDWFSLSTEKYDWGTFFIDVASPLVVGAAGETGVDVSVFMHFEDFEMAAPIIDLVPTSESSGRSRRFKAKVLNKIDEDSEQASSGGNLSKTLRSVGGAADALSAIPILNPIAAPVSWAANIAAGVASAFGWAKPNSTQSIQPMVSQIDRYGATSDGVQCAIPTGLLMDGKVRLTDGMSITNEDEMSAPFLYSIEGYYGAYSWTTSQAANTQIFNIELCPRDLNSRDDLNGTVYNSNVAVGAPFNYLAQLAQLWRGCIEMVVRVVKTDFHSGRLLFTYTPTSDASIYVAPTTTSGQYALREIIDIRVGNEFVLSFPYLLNYDYLATTEYSGTVDCRVLNELRAPETCSGTIKLMVFFRPGKDFELQTFGTTKTSSGIPNNLLVMSPSSGDSELVDEHIGHAPCPMPSTHYSELCIGESFSSVKQLISRWNAYNFNFNTSYTTGVTLCPHWFSSAQRNSTTGAITLSPVMDITSAIGLMYFYYRGGMDIKFVQIPTSGGVDTLCAPNVWMDTGYSTYYSTALQNTDIPFAWTAPSNSAALTSFNGIATLKARDGITIVNVPYYSKCKATLLVREPPADTTRPVDPSQPRAYVCYKTQYAVNYKVYRKPSDDFQFCYFIGCPPYVRSTTAV